MSVFRAVMTPSNGAYTFQMKPALRNAEHLPCRHPRLPGWLRKFHGIIDVLLRNRMFFQQRLITISRNLSQLQVSLRRGKRAARLCQLLVNLRSLDDREQVTGFHVAQYRSTTSSDSRRYERKSVK